MSKPAFRLTAKNKDSKEYIDIGAAFPTDYDGLYNFVLSPGTRIKVVQKWDKETKQNVKCDVVVNAEEFFVNLKDTAEGNQTVSQVRKTFKVDNRNDVPPPF